MNNQTTGVEHNCVLGGEKGCVTSATLSERGGLDWDVRFVGSDGTRGEISRTTEGKKEEMSKAGEVATPK